jgi:Holliday junction resolvasome RuvABC endonuclease subunit
VFTVELGGAEMNALGKQVMGMQGWAFIPDVATVDPGLGGTGAAFWSTLSRAGKYDVIAPSDTHMETHLHGNWHDRMVRIVVGLTGMLKSWRTQTLVLEMPRLWSGKKKSQCAAASGKLFKLSALTGAIIVAARHADIQVAEVYPDEWKGQLDDRLVHKRIYRKLGLEFPTHVHDAVGMGLAIQGVLYERRG